MPPRRLRHLQSQFAPIAIGLLLGCDGLVGGACVHEYRDPVLALELSSIGPATVVLTAFHLDGSLLPTVEHLATAPAFHVRAAGDTLVCDVPCGFGVDQGRYTFTVGALGFEPKPITVDARYQEFHGGCPSFNRGSTRVAIMLRPASP